FKGNANFIYLDTHPGGTSFLTDTYTDGMIKNKGGISVGDQTAVNTWTSKCAIYSGTGDIGTSGLISAGGNISSGGNITSSGTITGSTVTGKYITCTGNTGSYITAPTAVGVYLQNTVISNNGYAWMELCGSNSGQAFIDFTTVNSDYRGRFSFTLSSNQYDWSVWNGTSSPTKMTLNSSGLSVGGTFVSASDKRLKFNKKPLSNALNIISQLEPVEYDQTYDLVDQYTA
ncbi:MAG: tail fiber domain-containing protein, partial [Candidatus Fonsibacter sp.]